MSDRPTIDLLQRVVRDGAIACRCGERHRIGVRDILVGDHALEESAEILRRRYGAGPALWVLSDTHTEAAAGSRWKAGVRASRISSRVLAGDPRPVPTAELVDELCSDVTSARPDLLVSVGSGVLSDLVKKISLETEVPNWCVVTAPSVDAYTSATAAIRVAGYHQALPARVSEVVVCDLGVIARAPRPLFLAGLGDLLAKFLANLDWNLARIVAGERFCETLAEISLDSARRTLAAVRAARGGDLLDATWSLTEAVLLSGLAMQAFGGSRPAASAEHTIAHFWEMAGEVGSKEHDLHGILVGAASRFVLPGYLTYYRRLRGVQPGAERRLAAYDQEQTWEEGLEPAMRPFRAQIAQEMRTRVYDRSALAHRLETFAAERERIVAMALFLLAELSSAIRVLEDLGFPFALGELGISEPARMLPVRNVRLLRDRYTTFDLAYEMGSEEELIGTIARCA